jgi:hypothetical protein
MKHLLLAAVLLAVCLSASAGDSLSVFYFGNSLTANTMPKWHGALGKSAGKEWTAHAWLGAGWQLWQHREGLRQGGAEFDPSSQGDLTISDEHIVSRNYHVLKLFNQKWDAIVLQAFSPHLELVATQMWGKVCFDEPTDCGDIQSAADLIAFFLKLNPEGRVFLYQVWPRMRSGKDSDGGRDAETPLRDQFDYEEQWEQEYISAPKPWQYGDSPHRTRDFNEKLFKALVEMYPELWEEGRLRMIPSGDIYQELDKAMRKRKVPGLRSISEFYTDIQHQRAGLARYTIAAIFYACLFEEHPEDLDWEIYNDAKAYGPDPHHDAGELLEIDEEQVEAINDIIWETLTDHPYSGLNK